MPATRREFLVQGLRLSALLPALPLVGGAERRESGARVLVVLQLTGGNDGLNMVVPHGQDAYYQLRPTLALKRSSLHVLDEGHGLHPAMAGLGVLHSEGTLTIVHGVGYPQPDRSHFRSLEIWHTADPVGPARTGWLGRLADQVAQGGDGTLAALHVGDEELPLALVGESSYPPSLRDEGSLELRELAGLAAARTELLAGDAANDLGFLRRAAGGAYRFAERMSRAASGATPVDYPGSTLARKLRLVARLLSGGLDTRIFLLVQGGYDTHARQAATHAALLEELSRALFAFQRDLERSGLAGRVLTLVFSEFGRRAAENASRGTDHGAAAPVLLLGGGLRGGLCGVPPDLEHLVEGDVAFSTDLRALYGAIEGGWMGLERSSAVPALPLF
jgi:uncharacterized protein (DUF1501 family)